jgi:hypothetical protein
VGTNDAARNHRSGLSGGGAVILVASSLGIVAEVVRISTALRDGTAGQVVALELGIASLAVLLLVWLLFFWFWVRSAIRVRTLAAKTPDAVFVDALLNARLSSDLGQVNAVLGVPPRFMYTPGYITVVATREGLAFYSRAFGPRLLCFLPAEQISSFHIETIEFDTRTVTRYFPAIIVTPRGRAEGFTIGMMPMRWTSMVPHKLNPARMRAAVEALASAVGATVSAS